MKWHVAGAGLILVSLVWQACGQKQDPFASDAGEQDPVSYSEQISSLLQSHCAACHGADKQGAARNGAPVGVDLDSYAAASQHAERANARIQQGSMPPAGPLSDEDKLRFQAWIDQGLPE